MGHNRAVAFTNRKCNFFDTQRFHPVYISTFLIAAVFGWLLLEIGQGILSQSGDEMLTAERSREMLLLGRSAVHFNFSPSFEKPPLQYWVTSLTLPRFSNKTLAVRIWPWFYGILTAISVAWLARIVEPERPWLAPLSVAILVSCPLFATDASRGLLDTGLAFFTTTAIIFAELSRRNSAWWIGVAASCWLASLQKIPLTFVVWLLILGTRMISKSERLTLRSWWLPGSLVAALVAMAIWPAIQMANYRIPLSDLFHQEIVDHLGPERLGANPYFEIPYRLGVTSGSGVFLLLVPVAILLWKKWKFNSATREIATACIGLIILETLLNFRNVRYIEAIVPALCFLLALVLYRFFENRGKLRGLATTLLILLAVEGLIQTDLQIRSRRKNLAAEKRVAEELGSRQQQGVRTILVKAMKVGNDLHFGSFYLFHGNLRYPITKLTVDEIRQSPPPPPLIGVCVERDLAAVRSSYPTVRVEFARAPFVIWRVE